ncbi:MAG: orotate phosphoribosyltransferase [Deltaproteobacteria bacterium]|nr:orotate phosphoribosyltransferase [Deltaproteobacteria bacterium]
MRERLLDLLRTHSFRKGAPGEFLLASGKRSDFFINCKATVLRSEAHHLVGNLVLDLLGRFGPLDGVGGVAIGACPLVSAVATVAHGRGTTLDAFYVRLSRKDHGMAQKVDGLEAIPEGGRVAMVEDVLTTGGSLRHGIEQARGSGLVVVGAVVLVDRLEGGREAIEEMGVRLETLYSRKDFMDG